MHLRNCRNAYDRYLLYIYGIYVTILSLIILYEFRISKTSKEKSRKLVNLKKGNLESSVHVWQLTK